MVNPILTTSVSVGFETLRTNPLRTILSTLGIVIGVAALVSVLSVGDGMERLAREQIGRTTDLQRIAVIPKTIRIVDGTPFPQPNPVKFTAVDAIALRQVVHFAMQGQQLTREGELPVSQFRFALQHDKAAVLGHFDGLGLRLFHTVAFEAGAAIDEPGIQVGVHQS